MLICNRFQLEYREYFNGEQARTPAHRIPPAHLCALRHTVSTRHNVNSYHTQYPDLLTGIFQKNNEPSMPAAPLKWKYAASVYLKRHHCLLYRDEQLGVQKQVMTRRFSFLFHPREREYFFIDGVDDTFRSESALLRALERVRNNGNGRHQGNGKHNVNGSRHAPGKSPR